MSGEKDIRRESGQSRLGEGRTEEPPSGVRGRGVRERAAVGERMSNASRSSMLRLAGRRGMVYAAQQGCEGIESCFEACKSLTERPCMQNDAELESSCNAHRLRLLLKAHGVLNSSASLSRPGHAAQVMHAWRKPGDVSHPSCWPGSRACPALSLWSLHRH